MPRYYCDYCDTYLTHDSPSVRKQHNAGYKHKANVRDYYEQFLQQQNQVLMDQRIKEQMAIAAAARLPPFMMPPMGAFPPHMLPQRPGMPPAMMAGRPPMAGQPWPGFGAPGGFRPGGLPPGPPGRPLPGMGAPAAADSGAAAMPGAPPGGPA